MHTTMDKDPTCSRHSRERGARSVRQDHRRELSIVLSSGESTSCTTCSQVDGRAGSFWLNKYAHEVVGTTVCGKGECIITIEWTLLLTVVPGWCWNTASAYG